MDSLKSYYRWATPEEVEQADNFPGTCPGAVWIHEPSRNGMGREAFSMAIPLFPDAPAESKTDG